MQPQALLRFTLSLITSLSPVATLVAQDSPPRSPLPPNESVAHIRVHPAARIEVVAHEPQVIDPVAVRFDEHGGMWVVEMRDYPHGPKEGQLPKSRVKLLEDTDGDGFYETASIFADQLLFATGIQPWRGGLIVTSAGKVEYMKDTDGDRRADLRETWFTGFAEQNPQLRANHPTLGIDNHIYIANGLRGGAVIDPRREQADPISISGMDFRFDPFSFAAEAVSGVGQFGLTFDDFGNRFVCSNRNPAKHIVLADRYVKKNPLARIPTTFHDVATAGAASRIYALSRAWTTSNLHAGQFTAACGVTIFRGSGLPQEFYGNVFTCDPTGNLIHREVMQPRGPTFVSQPARSGVEFLASTDEWFRPVNMENGPDGAMYVVDMYRAVIEHPQFMPTELKTRPDMTLGDDRGRIYRVVAKTGVPAESRQLANFTPAELVTALGDRNALTRETAARLILETRETSLADSLRQQAHSAPQPVTRVHALWLLEGLQQLEPGDLERSLADAAPRVREQAVRLAEDRIGSNEALRRAVLARLSDDDPTVAFRAALVLAPLRDDDTEFEALASMVTRYAEDEWLIRAMTIAAGPHADRLLTRLGSQRQFLQDGSRQGPLLGALAAVGAKVNPQATAAALIRIHDRMPESGKRSALAALTAFGDVAIRTAAARKSLVASLSQENQQALQALVQMLNEKAADANTPVDTIGPITQALSRWSADDTVIAKLALEHSSADARRAAIGSLSRTQSLAPWRELVDRFRSESPSLRGAILDGVLARSDRLELLLTAMEAGQIKPSEIDRTSVNRLLKYRDARLRERAKTLLAGAIGADRKKALAEYQPVLTMPADALRGKAVFTKHCAACHKIGDVGTDVAPDISDSRSKTPEYLLTAIIQPNLAIDNNYIGYSVITDDGQVLTGILTSESGTSITLKQLEGKSITLLRDEIEQLQSTGISYMPEGLEKNISPQQMADVISFVKNWRYLDGQTPIAPPGESP